MMFEKPRTFIKPTLVGISLGMAPFDGNGEIITDGMAAIIQLLVSTEEKHKKHYDVMAGESSNSWMVGLCGLYHT